MRCENMNNDPLTQLTKFLKNEKEILEKKGKEDSEEYHKMHLVGYALDIGYDIVRIITNDSYKIDVGGIPKNAFLIMAPEKFDNFDSHFILLQVKGTSETPLTKEVQQTYFELHKKSMPELDHFTSGELQWGALETTLLGMFYADPDDKSKIEFSHDLVNFQSAHKYRVYSPNSELLDVIVNSLILDKDQFAIGDLRITENQFAVNEQSFPKVEVKISTRDIIGYRTALFGKTRLGKSNTVKIIAKSILNTTEKDQVGQLIFDVDGEYANVNNQDETSLANEYPDRCEIYSFSPKKNSNQKQLNLNFFEFPNESITMLRELLKMDDETAHYVERFYELYLPSIEKIFKMEIGDQIRAQRQIWIYWAILAKAGFKFNFSRLQELIPINSKKGPRFRGDLLEAAYRDKTDGETKPDSINDMDAFIHELDVLTKYLRDSPNTGLIRSRSSNEPLFQHVEESLLGFLFPVQGTGAPIISPHHKHHSIEGGNSIKEIIDSLDLGNTVILDLANSHPDMLQYYSRKLSESLFNHQQKKFIENNINENKFIQIYFEEAHNLFPKESDSDAPEIYRRIAKEGAKFHIGMIYSTQSITTIDRDLLAQTENYFIAHLSSKEQVTALNKFNHFFETYEKDILNAKRVGYLRIMTQSHRFAIPVQINKFQKKQSSVSESKEE